MNHLSYGFNRKPVFFRVGVTLLLMFVVLGAWYSLFSSRVTQKNNQLLSRIAYEQEEMTQLNRLEHHQAELVYKSDISNIPPKDVLTQLMSSVTGLTLTDFKAEAPRVLVVDNPGNKILKEVFNLHLNQSLILDEFTISFSGDYYGALDYLKQIAEKQYPIFLESIDYQVTVPPKAHITVKAFTIEEPK